MEQPSRSKESHESSVGAPDRQNYPRSNQYELEESIVCRFHLHPVGFKPGGLSAPHLIHPSTWNATVDAGVCWDARVACPLDLFIFMARFWCPELMALPPPKSVQIGYSGARGA